MAYRTTSWKNTDIGYIPSDWSVKKLHELCDYSKESIGFKQLTTLNFVGVDNLLQNCKGKEKSNFIPTFGNYPKYVKGDILISNIRPYLKKIWLAKYEGGSSPDVLVLHKKTELNDQFLYYNLANDKFFEYEMQNTKGIKMPRGDKDWIMNYDVLYPDVPEQQKIAEVLTDLDDLIAELENVRDKKQAIKIGAMQELLTGKRRLPGFNKPWKEVELGSVCTIETGKKDVNEGNPSGKYYFFTCAKEHTFADSFSYDTEAILIAGNGEVGHCQYYNGKFEVYQRTYVLYNCITNIKLLFQYMMYFFQKYIQDEIQQGAMPYIKRGTLRNFNVLFPVDETEQEKLEQILSDMDDEISAINDKINKYKQIKAGVADELLSGRIRLIKPQE